MEDAVRFDEANGIRLKKKQKRVSLWRLEGVKKSEGASPQAPSAPIEEQRHGSTALPGAPRDRRAPRHRRGRYVPTVAGYRQIPPPVHQPWRALPNSRARQHRRKTGAGRPPDFFPPAHAACRPFSAEQDSRARRALT